VFQDPRSQFFMTTTDEKIKSNDKPQKEEVTEQKSNSSKNKKSKR